MNFSSAAKAQMQGRKVQAAVLVELRFVSGTERLWEGFGPLVTLDGHSWDGTSGLGEITGLGQSINGTSPPLTLTLSGVDADFAAKAKAESDEYYNQAAVPYLQFFDEDWACLDNPYPLGLARMTNLTSKMESTDAGLVHTVSITAESPFATRRRPRYGYYTDRDQQLRHPGDRGLERVAGIDNKTITFPDF